MDKNNCIKYMEKFFKLNTDILWLKNPDFLMQSRIFYYRSNFKGINDIKIATAKSKNISDDIVFDIYFIRAEFETLFSGYFKIVPVTSAAETMFEGVSKLCTDLGEYFYYVYQNSEFLKIYFATGSVENALEHHNRKKTKEGAFDFNKFKEDMYLEISSYSQEELREMVLNRNLTKKYVSNFIKLNSKCSEYVKMFLINILSEVYIRNICIINNAYNVKNYILVEAQNAKVNSYPKVCVYDVIEKAVKENALVLVKFNYDFKTGG
ncbi:MAG TPA: hypothetical protein DCE02_00390 [Ruminiclostridium sp.]|uniref:Uncharacterized protein n=3 Tax=Acetivibrio saccincola TaxID=1677857 RepID=A0A2K9E161_9FIRM|nr:hypothetical protein [Acetivibrio saccincola]AUG57517.1 hypothetical protein HVS_08035 [Acetivibrio saccincola]NLW26015.1 hypothetical protein [Acetivibrio saccincola]PQQ67432.1 hypothetical protein B9R14_12200 [Acetivibrio saccincola]HAA42451.1 hypothetical protein [Ruminiclostridium sp.]